MLVGVGTGVELVSVVAGCRRDGHAMRGALP